MTQQAAAKPSKVAITRMLAEIDSRRRRSTRYWLLLLLAPLLLGAGLLAYTFREVREKLAERDRLNAEIAELEARKAELKSENGELTSKNALLALTVNKITGDVREAAKTGEGVKALEDKILNSVGSNPTVAEATPRVFIHIHGEGQREKARQIAQALKDSGYTVPGIERRPERVRGNQVKFFRQEEKGVADKVAGILASQGVTDVRTVFAGGFKTPPGHFEIWFAPSSPQASDGPAGSREDPEKRTDTVFAVVRGDFNTLEGAVAYAKELSARELPFPVEVYRRSATRFYVTLGGYLTYDEAVKRTEYAKRAGLSKDAYPSDRSDLGENLYR